MKLRKADSGDLIRIMDWIDNEKACRIWAGPGFRFPFNRDQFVHDLGFHMYETYALVDEADLPVALGQIIHRNNRLHLARILVMPALRGKGFGRCLCTALIKEGKSRHGNKAFSLNVYRHNTIARKLYETLGFREAADQSEAASPDSVFMILE
jgi:ribosomal protein S18 acetylase RimI-like enzyme